MRKVKAIVEEHPEVHIETFGEEAWGGDSPVIEALVAEAAVAD